jgi:hypothetical protein
LPSVDILRSVAIERTPRVMQLEGMFDLSVEKVSESKWSVHLDLPEAWLPMPTGTMSNAYREHRTVTLPDFQGVGIGNALSAYCASMWRGLGKRVFSTTSHPSMIAARERSPLWRCTRALGLGTKDAGNGKMKHALTRMTAGFEYIGETMPATRAQELLNVG